MTQSFGSTGRQIQDAGRRAMEAPQEAAEQVAAKPWAHKLARFGLAARGVIYVTIGALAIQAALGRGGETTDSRGALAEIGRQPFGQVLLALLGVGLIGYTLWRVLQAFADTEGKGSTAKGLAVRAGYLGSGLIHAALAVAAFQMIDGGGSGGGGQTQSWTAELLSKPFGQWLVGLVGASVIGFGLWQLWSAYKARFRKHFNLGGMSATQQKWATRIGRLGYAARGVVFGIMGWFFIQAALNSNPGEVRGLDGALQALADQSHGPWLLGIVALGLFCYGLESFVEARYRRIGLGRASSAEGHASYRRHAA